MLVFLVLSGEYNESHERPLNTGEFAGLPAEAHGTRAGGMGGWARDGRSPLLSVLTEGVFPPPG